MAEETISSLSESPAVKPPQRRIDLRLLVIILTLILFVLSLPLAVYLVKQRQEIRMRAGGENQLVCMPIDDAGNLTNEKYRYNRIKVINNTNEQVILWIQDNICDYIESPGPGDKCDNYARRYSDTLPPTGSKIYTINVPCNKTGQLDIAQDDDQMGQYTPDCYNTVDENIWQGGIAFTIHSRSCQATPTPTLTPLPTPTGTVTPSPTPSPTPTGTITPSPTPTGEACQCQCSSIAVFNEDWEAIEDADTIEVEQTVHFGVKGTADENCPSGITKARFRVNETASEEWCEGDGFLLTEDWCETTNQQSVDEDEYFYLTYFIPGSGDYKVESMVYCSDLEGWR